MFLITTGYVLELPPGSYIQWKPQLETFQGIKLYELTPFQGEGPTPSSRSLLLRRLWATGAPGARQCHRSACPRPCGLCTGHPWLSVVLSAWLGEVLATAADKSGAAGAVQGLLWVVLGSDVGTGEGSAPRDKSSPRRLLGCSLATFGCPGAGGLILPRRTVPRASGWTRATGGAVTTRWQWHGPAGPRSGPPPTASIRGAAGRCAAAVPRGQDPGSGRSTFRLLSVPNGGHRNAAAIL